MEEARGRCDERAAQGTGWHGRSGGPVIRTSERGVGDDERVACRKRSSDGPLLFDMLQSSPEQGDGTLQLCVCVPQLQDTIDAEDDPRSFAGLLLIDSDDGMGVAVVRNARVRLTNKCADISGSPRRRRRKGGRSDEQGGPVCASLDGARERRVQVPALALDGRVNEDDGEEERGRM